ncbi:MAG TPA: hypothetical protein VFL14_09745 [Xanthomonadales bacterium]|nr:hypothetical protein [Xanthomonadales bacterium]
MSALRRECEAAAARLREWLLRGPVQVAEGPQAGGIVGSFTPAGEPAYVYGEITGYYLHWLAGLPHDARVAANAVAACAWAARWFSRADDTPTRIHFGEPPSDWRNDAVFLFDLAMLARGLAVADRARLCTVPATLSDALGRAISRFHDGGRLLPLLRIRPDAQLPDRWSTRDDAFLLKAATRVLDARPPIAVDDDMLDACSAFQRRRAPLAGEAPVEMLHPTLYYLEAVLAGDARHWPGAARLLARLLALRNDAFELPEAPPADGPRRSDVIAQALRVGTFLRARGVDGAPDADVLDGLARALVARVAPDGTIAFRVDTNERQPNAWCAMFAEQALRWHADPAAADAALLV